MQVLLLPLRQSADKPSGYALEKQAALAELVALKRARRRVKALMLLKTLRRPAAPTPLSRRVGKLSR